MQSDKYADSRRWKRGYECLSEEPDFDVQGEASKESSCMTGIVHTADDYDSGRRF